MKQNHKLALLQTGYNTVAVSFNCDFDLDALDLRNNKLYTYKNILPLKVDDLVVVPANSGFNVVRVIEVHNEPQIDLDSDIIYKWTISKVDMEAYNKILEGEEEALKKLNKAERKVVQNKAREELKVICGDEIPQLDYSKSGTL